MAQGRTIVVSQLAFAAWLYYVLSTPEKVRDPLAEKFAAVAASLGVSLDAVQHILSINEIFPPNICQHSQFIQGILDIFKQICDSGIQGTLEQLAFNMTEEKY